MVKPKKIVPCKHGLVQKAVEKERNRFSKKRKKPSGIGRWRGHAKAGREGAWALRHLSLGRRSEPSRDEKTLPSPHSWRSSLIRSTDIAGDGREVHLEFAFAFSPLWHFLVSRPWWRCHPARDGCDHGTSVEMFKLNLTTGAAARLAIAMEMRWRWSVNQSLCRWP